MGLKEVKNFSRYHNVLRRSKWCGITASKMLLGLLISLLPDDFPIIVAIDETLERRRGTKIKAKGLYRDAVRSSQSNIVKSMGLSWQCMTLIVPLPWSSRHWALPFMTVLAPSEKANQTASRRHKTSIDWTQQMVVMMSRWLRQKPWILVGDGAYAKVALMLCCIKHNVSLVTRMRCDAALHEYPEFRPKQQGRPKKVGERIYLKERYESSKQKWNKGFVTWYGGKRKEVEYFQLSCLWYLVGREPIPLKVVVLKKNPKTQDMVVLASTDLKHTPEQIIEYFVLRWNIEVTFEEARAHLGIETQRQWSDKAIERTTPLLMAVFSLVTLLGAKAYASKRFISTEITSWYCKNSERTFSDILIMIRKQLWLQRFLSNSADNDETYNLYDKNIEQLVYMLSLTG